MPEMEPQSGTDMTARLVDQLTRTNERLERLEAALRERSLLPGIQQEPAGAEPAAPAALTQGSAAANGSNGAYADTQDDSAKEAETHFRRGVAFVQAGKYDEALVAWQQVLRLQPDNAYALANTGIVYTEQGRWNEAREMFKRVLAIQPDNAEAHYGLGMADAQLGDYPAAIASWENTLRLQPENTDARYNLALVRQRLSSETAPPASAVTTYRPPNLPQPSAPEPPAPTLAAGRQSAAPAAGAYPAVATSDSAIVGSRGGSNPGAADRGEAADGREWKRLDAARRKTSLAAPQNRSAARVTRPPGGQPNRTPAITIGVVALAVVGALLYNNYHRPPMPVGAPVSNGPAVAAHPAAAAVSKPAALSPKGGVGSSPASPYDPSAMAPAVYPAVLPPAPEPHAAAAPTQPGKMQIRLAPGLNGRFRYWFVSGSERAARMKALPRSARGGLITLFIPAEYNQRGAQLRILNVDTGKVARVSVIDTSRPRSIVTPHVGKSLLQNSDFSQGTAGWRLEVLAPARGSMKILDGMAVPPGVTGHAVEFNVAAKGAQPWSVQFLQPGVNLADGGTYLISFWARADRNRALHMDAILDKPNYHRVGVIRGVQLSRDWHKFLLPVTVHQTQPQHTQISFIIGEYLGSVDIAGVNVRPSLGRDIAAAPNPNMVVTVGARDFN